MSNYSGCGGYGSGVGYSAGDQRCGYSSCGYSGNSSYAALEQIVVNTPTEFIKAESAPLNVSYSQSHYAKGLYSNNSKAYFAPSAFLNPDRPSTQFVGKAEEIKEFVQEAFKQTTGQEFPEGIMLSVCDEKTMKRIHERTGGSWSEGIQGFALNNWGRGISEVFIREGQLDSVMLVAGHEIGHVLSQKLGNAKDEEAKAFAFSLAWMQTIVKHNIAGLKNCINPMPASNGLHDVAFAFVQKIISAGKTAFEAYKDLARGLVSINKQTETIFIN